MTATHRVPARFPGPPVPGHQARPPVAMVLTAVVLVLVTTAAACAPGPTDTAGAPKAGSTATGASARKASAGCRVTTPANPVAAGHHGTQTLTVASGVGADSDSGTGPVTVSGSYVLSVPRTYRSRRPAPLILLFYGFASDPAEFSSLTGLPARGAKDGFLVAVPHIQAGETEWQFSGRGTDADFVDGVVSSLERRYCVDESAVFAAGFSAGAAFTIAYSCAHESQIRAIVTVAVEFQLGCRQPLPIMAFHGTDDPLVPYQNGAIGLSLPGIKVRGTELNMGDWARLDHCRPSSDRTRMAPQVVRQQWPGCRRGTDVILYTVLGGGHAWPGADPSKAVGLTTQQISATTEALSFFGRFRS